MIEISSRFSHSGAKVWLDVLNVSFVRPLENSLLILILNFCYSMRELLKNEYSWISKAVHFAFYMIFI